MKKTEASFFRSFIQFTRLPLIFLILGFLFKIIAEFTLTPAYKIMANDITLVIIIIAVAWILLKILAMMEHWFHEKKSAIPIDLKTQKDIELYTKIHILRNIAATVIIIIAIAASLMVFDKVRNIGISLLASAGFLTAILALTAQKSLGSLFVGLQLVLTNPLRIGDLIVFENESGVVEEITLTFIVIRIWDGRRLIVPINHFIEKPFQNWSRETQSFLGDVKMYVDYDVPVDAIRHELDTILKDHTAWDGRKSAVSVSDFKENCVEVRIIISAKTPAAMDLLRSDVREKMLDFLCNKHKESLPKRRISSSMNTYS